MYGCAEDDEEMNLKMWKGAFPKLIQGIAGLEQTESPEDVKSKDQIGTRSDMYLMVKTDNLEQVGTYVYCIRIFEAC